MRTSSCLSFAALVVSWTSMGRAQTLPRGCEGALERRLQEALAAQQAGDHAQALELATVVSSVLPTGTLHGFMARQLRSLDRPQEALREARECVRGLPSQPAAEERGWYERFCPALIAELEGQGVSAALPAPPPPRPSYCVEPAQIAPPMPQQEAPRTSVRRPIVGPAIVAGSGAVLLGLGGAFYALASSANADAQLHQSVAEYEVAERYAWSYVGSMIAGGAAVAVGTLWYVFGATPVNDARRARSREPLRWTIVPSEHGVFAGVGGAL